MSYRTAALKLVNGWGGLRFAVGSLIEISADIVGFEKASRRKRSVKWRVMSGKWRDRDFGCATNAAYRLPPPQRG